jgi:hypothetical protein
MLGKGNFLLYTTHSYPPTYVLVFLEVFPSGFSTNNLYLFLFSPIRATCLAHLPDLIILIIIGEEYNFQTICPSPTPLQAYYFYCEGVVSTTPNLQAGGPPFVGSPRLLIQYISRYPP